MPISREHTIQKFTLNYARVKTPIQDLVALRRYYDNHCDQISSRIRFFVFDIEMLTIQTPSALLNYIEDEELKRDS